jgi:hypothetical protein
MNLEQEPPYYGIIINEESIINGGNKVEEIRNTTKLEM